MTSADWLSLFGFRRSGACQVGRPRSRLADVKLLFCPAARDQRQDVNSPPRIIDRWILAKGHQNDMLRQISLRTALSAPRQAVAASFSSPILANTTRFLTTESAAPTETINPPTLQTQKPTTSTQAPRQLTYLVGRTASNNVSVYNDKRSGGTRKETTIKKIQGNAQDLKKDLINELKFKKDDVNVNPVTGHVKIKVRSEMERISLVIGSRISGTCANFTSGMALGTSENLARSSWFLIHEDIEDTKRCMETFHAIRSLCRTSHEPASNERSSGQGQQCLV